MKITRGSHDDFAYFLHHGRARRPLAGSLLLGLILAFFAVAFTWASLTEIDEVTRGQGKVVPSRNLQVVQNLEGGVVEEIRVTRGDRVVEGDVLMVLGGGRFEGEFQEVQQRYFALQAKVQRLQAEVNELPLKFTPALERAAPSVVASETRLFHGRRLELASELQVLERQRFQREQELVEARASLETARAGFGLVQGELELVEPLVRRGLEPETALLQLRRTLNELRGERERQSNAIPRIEAAIQEVEDRKQAQRDSYMVQALAELSDTTALMAELQEGLPARARQVERTTVRAPVDGVVNQVHLHTIGGVAAPGEPLVEVVPVGDSLLIEAHIRPSDIAFLYPGQPVRVKLTAYDFARYGGLNGELVMIGADAVEVPQGQASELMYPVQVRTEGHLYDADNKPLDVIPGMIAEVDILSGKRRVLDYLIEPVVKVRDRALRD
ncbi:HlyD family type I secretion periplasmic adaptor subunit [Halomonas mongoliensis]|uniref:HlyD family type I secretion periplasmic adaptor subunit n=1 Tax=Halomonas mongoliensis TaxID=321265 RepID=UPI00403AD8D8